MPPCPACCSRSPCFCFPGSFWESEGFEHFDQKVGIYLRAGVREVWLIDPSSANGKIHRIGNVEPFSVGELPASRIVPGFAIDLARLLET